MKITKKILIVLVLLITSFNFCYSYATENEDVDIQVNEKEVTEESNWETTFENLPKYDEEGFLIEYTIKEDEIPEGYEKYIEGNIIKNSLKVCNYRIEYYYDGIIDSNLTFYGIADFGSKIEKYKEQPKEGYIFYKAENVGFEITTEENQNVIRVYYISMPLTGGKGINNFILLGMILSILGFNCLAIFKNKQKN